MSDNTDVPSNSKNAAADNSKQADDSTATKHPKSIQHKMTHFTAMLKQKSSALRNRSLLELIMPIFGISLVLVAITASVFAYRLGVKRGQMMSLVVATDDAGKPLTAQDIKAISLENAILKNEIETLIKERDISLNNLNLVQDELQSLKQGNAELKVLTENLSETLNQQSAIKGATADVVEMGIEEIGENTYEYHFDVMVPSVKDKRIEPKLTLLNATSMVEIPLTPSSYQSKGLIQIRGRFVMPNEEGGKKLFEPSQLRLMLVVDGERIPKLYNWRVN